MWPCFQSHDLKMGSEMVTMYSCDILQSIQALYGNPDFAAELIHKPERHYQQSGNRKWRVFHDMHTGSWWWEIQVSILQCVCCDANWSTRQHLRLISLALRSFPSSLAQIAHSSLYLATKQRIHYTWLSETYPKTSEISCCSMVRSCSPTSQHQSWSQSPIRLLTNRWSPISSMDAFNEFYHHL